MYFNVNAGLSGWFNSWYIATKVGDYNKTGGVHPAQASAVTKHMQLSEQMSTGNRWR